MRNMRMYAGGQKVVLSGTTTVVTLAIMAGEAIKQGSLIPEHHALRSTSLT
jgi:hypothetical protein